MCLWQLLTQGRSRRSYCRKRRGTTLCNLTAPRWFGINTADAVAHSISLPDRWNRESRNHDGKRPRIPDSEIPIAPPSMHAQECSAARCPHSFRVGRRCTQRAQRSHLSVLRLNLLDVRPVVQGVIFLRRGATLVPSPVHGPHTDGKSHTRAPRHGEFQRHHSRRKRAKWKPV